MSKITRPDDLATLLMRYYNRGLEVKSEQTPDLTIEGFLATNESWSETLDIGYLFHVISRLQYHGFLFSLGGELFKQRFLSANFSEIHAEYGVYENRVKGPTEIFRRHSPAVHPIIVEDAKGKPDIGTGFLVGSLNTMFTARHVIENKKEIKFSNADPQPFHIKAIHVHKDPNIDVAMLHVENKSAGSAKPFRYKKHQLGQEILSIGFPPIPRFDQLKVLEHGEIGSEIKVMNGQIVSSGKDYIESVEYFLINARVKGGSSGAPVIDPNGFVVGIVVDAAVNANASDQLVGLGYGIVSPFGKAKEMVSPNNRSQLLEIRHNSDGSASTLI